MRSGILTKFVFPMSRSGKRKKYIKENKGRGHKFESKEEYFSKNGAILLEKQIALSKGQDVGALQMKIFSEKELRNATNNNDPDLVIGSNHGSVVYKASLDDRTVVIKTPQEDGSNPEMTDLLLTDVSVGMVICHTNMVKIYGCCLETCIPMIVYEFYPNKDLHRYLHGGIALHKPMKWSSRLKGATDIAYALSYMHNALPKPVVHRHVMSYGVLLDSSFQAKLKNFGYSVSITPGKKDESWPVRGTPGYIDPEYIETRKVTDKCDVYSFGVLMLEMLTGRDPIEMAWRGKRLVTEFVSTAERNGVNEMIDKNVLEEGNMDEIQRFLRLALTCVADKGEDRPTMISVVEQLWQIQEDVMLRIKGSAEILIE
ncbi:hypothetical protein RND81_12G168000 [Saponaria officinalis]|uniref:Protein kinase domain-containing protein n=1 Tax=Saponaria officinalis TaxID=3572 RepID=A0AAW1HBM5_SAPOF